jgi:hypothetical protein
MDARALAEETHRLLHVAFPEHAAALGHVPGRPGPAAGGAAAGGAAGGGAFPAGPRR